MITKFLTHILIDIPTSSFGRINFGRISHGPRAGLGQHYLQKIIASSDFATIFCESSKIHLAKLLQKIIASQKTNTSPSHVATIFCESSCKVVTKDSSIPENPKHHSHVATIFCESSCKVVTKDSSIPEKPTHVATIFCYHLAKLLQKIVATQKNQHMLLLSFVIILQSCYKR
jgi:hypothetical protein